MSAVCLITPSKGFIFPPKNITIKVGEQLSLAFFGGRPNASDDYSIRLFITLTLLRLEETQFVEAMSILDNLNLTYMASNYTVSLAPPVLWTPEGDCGDTAIQYNWTIPEEAVAPGVTSRYAIWGKFSGPDSSIAQYYSNEFAIDAIQRTGTITNETEPDSASLITPEPLSSQSNNQSLVIGLGAGLGVVALLALLGIGMILLRQRTKRGSRGAAVEESQGFEKSELSGKMIGDSHCKMQELSGEVEVKELDSKSPIPEVSARAADADRDSIDYSKATYEGYPQELDNTEIRSSIEVDEGEDIRAGTDQTKHEDQRVKGRQQV